MIGKGVFRQGVITPKIATKDKPFKNGRNAKRYDFAERYFIKQGETSNRLAPLAIQKKTIHLSNADKVAWRLFVEGKHKVQSGSLMDWKLEEMSQEVLGRLWKKYKK